MDFVSAGKNILLLYVTVCAKVVPPLNKHDDVIDGNFMKIAPEMKRRLRPWAEPTNNRTAGIDTNHSTMFTLLLELNLICEQRCLNCKIVPLRQNVHYHLPNLWNQITTKIFDIFRIITLKQQKFSQSDPVLIRQFSKKIVVRSSPDPAKIGFSPDPVLIRAHLCKIPNIPPAGNLRKFCYWYDQRHQSKKI